MSVEFSVEAKSQFDSMVSRYPDRRSAALPALHLAQQEFGHLSNEVMEYVAGLLEIEVSQLEDTVSFYSLFYRQPVGRHKVYVCQTLSCALRGAGEILSHIEKKLGVRAGERSNDGKVSVFKAECLASCGTAPMIQVDDDYHEGLTVEKVDSIMAGLN